MAKNKKETILLEEGNGAGSQGSDLEAGAHNRIAGDFAADIVPNPDDPDVKEIDAIMKSEGGYWWFRAS